jgi:hypothetical protein
MRRLRAAALLGALLLAGCAQPPPPETAYVPPAGASVPVQVTVIAKFDYASLEALTPDGSAFLAGPTFVEHNILKTPVPGVLNTQVWLVPGQTAYFAYVNVVKHATCNLYFSFDPEAGRNYHLYVGDFGPAPAQTGLGRFGQALFPLVGKGCGARLMMDGDNGTPEEMPLQDAADGGRVTLLTAP